MLIGDPKIFAVEIYHEPVGPEWAGFGRMCIHSQNLVMGDVNDEHCSLYHSIERICKSAESLTDLWTPYFLGKSDDEIFNFLDAILYTGDEPEFEGVEQFDFMTNTGEHFDRTKSFIHCTTDKTVKISFLDDSNILKTVSCSATSFQSVAQELSEWFRKQIET